MSNARIKAGIVGFGKKAEKTHLAEMLKRPDLFEVVGVCDVTESRREAAKALGVPTATGDLNEFLALEPELVFIAAHSSVHHELAMPCLARNCHLVIEKPVTLKAAEAEEIFAAAEKKGLMAVVFHNRRYDPDYRKIKKIVHEKGIGEFVLVENRTAGERPAVGFGVQDFHQEWRITKSMGGGTLMDFGPHWVDQILDLVPGTVKGVFADVRNIKWGDADDYFHIALVFDSGARAVASKADFVYHAPEKWLIYGTQATAWCAGGRDDAHWKSQNGEAVESEGVPTPDYFQNYFDVIRKGAAPVIDPKGSLRVARVIDAAYESAEKGELIRTSI